MVSRQQERGLQLLTSKITAPHLNLLFQRVINYFFLCVPHSSISYVTQLYEHPITSTAQLSSKQTPITSDLFTHM
ncbi:unnamed protein product [Arctogadus glacialis]